MYCDTVTRDFKHHFDPLDSKANSRNVAAVDMLSV